MLAKYNTSFCPFSRTHLAWLSLYLSTKINAVLESAYVVLHLARKHYLLAYGLLGECFRPQPARLIHRLPSKSDAI